MPMPPLQQRAVAAKLVTFCESRIPPHARHQIRLEYEIRGSTVTLLECRPRWDDETAPWTRMKVARFKFDAETHTWSLWWPDRNLKFHPYDRLEPTKDFEKLLAEVDSDPTCIFWG